MRGALQNALHRAQINLIVPKGHHNCRVSGNFTQPQAVFHMA